MKVKLQFLQMVLNGIRIRIHIYGINTQKAFKDRQKKGCVIVKKIWMYGAVLWVVLFVMTVFLMESKAENAPIAQETSVRNEDVSLSGSETETIVQMEAQTHTYDAGHTVKVKFEDEAIDVPLDKYLMGVVAAEMPAAFPMEALKAQAVAARTFVLRREAELKSGGKTGHNGAVICTDPGCCMAYCDLSTEAAEVFGSNAEAYLDKVKSAVSETDGEILTVDDIPILAAFHAISGGYTEDARDVWGSEVSYLVSVESGGEENAAKFYGEVTVNADAFCESILSVYPDAVFSEDPMEWFTSPVRGAGGGVVTVDVGGITVRGTALRSMLGLNSTDFTVMVGVDDMGEVTLTFHTTGYGHGVGMSQYGALAMAQDGHTYEDILKKYYTGVTLTMLPISKKDLTDG